MKKSKYVLVLKSVNADMTASKSFKYPENGLVACKDWKPTAECGNGLHGLLWGEGDYSLLNWNVDAKWLVIKVSEFVKIDNDKIKFPSGNVVYCGDRVGAADYIRAHGNKGLLFSGTATAGDRGTATAGYRGTATAGDRGTATAGDRGIATAGYSGTATAGDRGTATAGDSGTATAGYSGTATAGDSGTATAGYSGTATAGDSGTATAGDRGTATAGYSGTATAGYRGTATAGYSGTATAGDSGTATAGDSGTATAGYRGTATAGYRGTATAGDYGAIVIEGWDGERYVKRCAEVGGKKGLKPKTKYRLNDKLEFEEVL